MYPYLETAVESKEWIGEWGLFDEQEMCFSNPLVKLSSLLKILSSIFQQEEILLKTMFISHKRSEKPERTLLVQEETRGK